MSNTAENLKKALELFEDGNRWTKMHLATKKTPGATQYCLFGGINRVVFGDPEPSLQLVEEMTGDTTIASLTGARYYITDEIRCVHKAIRELYGEYVSTGNSMFLCSTDITDFNDDDETDWHDVKAVLNRAIEHAEKENK